MTELSRRSYHDERMSVLEREALRAASGLLKDQVVILTGAGGGIGQPLARMLAAAGATIVATDLRQGVVDEVTAEIGCYAEAFDASDWRAFGEFHGRVEATLGPVHGLINAAGLWAPSEYYEVDEHTWRQTLDANLATAFIACQAVLPGMVERRSGAIVNFASTAGEYGSIRAAAHYAAAKGGVIAMTKSLAREVSPFGVRLNAVSPGPIDTPALLASTAEQRQVAASRTLFGRLGYPHEIAGACVFLLSSLSTFVTGTVLQVNGGSRL